MSDSGGGGGLCGPYLSHSKATSFPETPFRIPPFGDSDINASPCRLNNNDNDNNNNNNNDSNNNSNSNSSNTRDSSKTNSRLNLRHGRRSRI